MNDNEITIDQKLIKVQNDLILEQEKNKKLEAKLKFLEGIVGNVNTESADVNIGMKHGNWEIYYTERGSLIYRHKNDKQYTWRDASNIQEVLKVIYEKDFN